MTEHFIETNHEEYPSLFTIEDNLRIVIERLEAGEDLEKNIDHLKEIEEEMKQHRNRQTEQELERLKSTVKNEQTEADRE